MSLKLINTIEFRCYGPCLLLDKGFEGVPDRDILGNTIAGPDFGVRKGTRRKEKGVGGGGYPLRENAAGVFRRNTAPFSTVCAEGERRHRRERAHESRV